MKRRAFSKIVLSASILFAGGVHRLAAAPVRVLYALRTRAFPGRLRPFDPNAVKRPGKWSG